MWKRLDESKLKNIGGITSLVKRVYGWEGKPWPRLTISINGDIMNGNKETNITVNCNQKIDDEAWWQQWGIPRELINDVKELLDEAANTPYDEEKITAQLMKMRMA